MRIKKESQTKFCEEEMMLIQGLMLICLSVVPAQPSQSAQAPNTVQAESETQEQNVRAYIELIRSDIRAQRVQIITQMMDLDDKEAAIFWPIYREFDLAFSKLGDEKLAIIQDYSKNYLTMTDAKADELAKRMLELEENRFKLRKTYYEKLKTALSPILAARFTQVEDQIEKILDLQIDSSLPIISEPDSK
jgi:hypothetical protein